MKGDAMKPLRYFVHLFTVLALLLLDLVLLLIFKEHAVLSVYSLIPLAFMALAVLNGILSCLLKRKGNFLILGKRFGPFFYEDLDYTFTEAYEKQFRRMLLIYLAAIPFYIPIIFFAKSFPETLFTLLVFFVPQIIFILMGIKGTLNEVKTQKRKEEAERRERKEQERREELGYWK